jgi:hypothetical protein
LGVLQHHEIPDNLESIENVEEETHHLLEMEELYWKQRAKCNWFQHGDRNTKFFHAWATERKRRNHIERIHDEVGREWTKQEDIG